MPEDIVLAPQYLAALERHQVLHLRDHAEQRRITLRISTDITKRTPIAVYLSEIAAIVAWADATSDIPQFYREVLSQGGFFREQVHDETQRRLFTDSGQAGQ